MSDYNRNSALAKSILERADRAAVTADVYAKIGIGHAILALAAAIKESAATKKEE